MMENKNSKVLIILIIILTILVIGLSSFIVYDKVLNKNNAQEPEKNNEIIENNENNNNLNKDEEKTENSEQNKEQNADSNLIDSKAYTFSDFSNTVFQNADGSGNNYLILWDNGTYSYENSLGNYIVDGQKIKLNFIVENNKNITKEKTIELTINSITELVDTKNNVTLHKVNHPTNRGGSEIYDAINNK